MEKRSYVFALALLAAAGFLVGGAAGRFAQPQKAMAQSEIQDTVTTNQMAVVDSAGNLRLLLSVPLDEGSPSMNFYDADGAVREVISLSPIGEPLINMNDTKGELRMVMGVTDEGGPGILLKDKAGKSVFGAPAQ